MDGEQGPADTLPPEGVAPPAAPPSDATARKEALRARQEEARLRAAQEAEIGGDDEQAPAGSGRSRKVAPARKPLREDMVSHAVTFLTDPNVQKTPIARQVSFLESKGLTSDEIQEALSRVRNPGGTTGPRRAARRAVEDYEDADDDEYEAPLPTRRAGLRAPPPLPPPPPPPPTTSWKQLVFTSVLSLGVGGGLAFLAKRYLESQTRQPGGWLSALLPVPQSTPAPPTPFAAPPSELVELKEQMSLLAHAMRTKTAELQQQKAGQTQILSALSQLDKNVSTMSAGLDRLQSSRPAADSLDRLQSSRPAADSFSPKPAPHSIPIAKKEAADDDIGVFTGTRSAASVAPSTSPSSTSTTAPGMPISTRSDTDGAASSMPPYSSKFLNIVNMMKDPSYQLPDVKEVDDEPSNLPIAKPKLAPATKPWETRRQNRMAAAHEKAKGLQVDKATAPATPHDIATANTGDCKGRAMVDSFGGAPAAPCAAAALPASFTAAPLSPPDTAPPDEAEPSPPSADDGTRLPCAAKAAAPLDADTGGGVAVAEAGIEASS